MVEHLKAAVNRYNESDREWHIHPISEQDAQIAGEVLELFKKLNFAAAADIMKSYKKVSDEDIYLNLLDLNTQIGKAKGKSQEESGDAPLFQRYLLACGRRIDIYLVIGYDSMDVPINDGSGMKYCILLNPTPPNVKSVPFYANEWLVFDTEAERDEMLRKMDGYMELFRGLFIK